MAKLKNEAKIKKLIVARERALDVGRESYKQADKLLDEMRAAGWKPDHVIELPGDREAELIDNFANKNKHFKNVSVSRYDVVIKQR